METHRVRKRFSCVVCIVLTLFLIADLFSPDVFAATRDSLLNQPSTMIAAPPVLLQAGIAGASTIYANSTSAIVNVAAPEYQNVTITITNNQTASTSSPFQQMITFNPSSYSPCEASDLGNIRFYSDSALTTPLYAWLESCTPSLSNNATSATAWIKLTSPIAANGGTLTIYMAFLSTNTTYDGNYWGDAPNLSTKYGQYDNGANVFTQYGGASWSSFTTVEGTWDTSNGYLEQTATTGNYVGGPAALIEGTSYSVSSSYILETAVSYTAEAIARVGIIADASLISGDPYGYRFIGQQGSNGAGFVSFLNDWVAWVVNNAYQGTVSTPYTLQVVDNAGTWSSTLYSGYGNSGAALTTLAATSYTTANENGATTGYVGVSAAYYTGSNVIANPAQFQWFRMRQMPPSNVMPSASFGSVTFYVLNVVNQVTSAWNVSLQVYGSSNIARLTSATISFYGGTSSNQIVVNGGSIVQSHGALYNLLGGSGSTVYVGMSNLLANATGASYLYVYLEIQTPNTSTYLAYTITFAIT